MDARPISLKLRSRYRNWISFVRDDKAPIASLRTWMKYFLASRGNPLAAGTPWFCLAAIDWLGAALCPTDDVFEWGSGGSTVFLSSRARSLISVEHSVEWYDRVAEHIRALGVSNVDLRLLPSTSDDPFDRGGSPDVTSQGVKDWVEYSAQIDDPCDGTYDVILIDGRARPLCLLNAVSKLRTGGFILLDNSERYECAIKKTLGEFRAGHMTGPIPFERTGFFSRTTVLFRPDELRCPLPVYSSHYIWYESY